MRIGVLTLLWKRRYLSEVVLDYYNRLEIPGVELVKVAVSSPEDEEQITSFPGWTILERPNRPISRKWNSGCYVLGDQKVDGVVVIGSDDFLSPSYFEILRELPEEIDYLTPSGLHMVDIRSLECIYLQRVRVGAGRFVRSSLLESVNWRGWESGVSAKLDSAMDRRLGRHIKRVFSFDPKEYGVTILDVKTDQNMWPFDLFAKRLSKHKVPAVLEELDGVDLFLPQLQRLRSSRLCKHRLI